MDYRTLVCVAVLAFAVSTCQPTAEQTGPGLEDPIASTTLAPLCAEDAAFMPFDSEVIMAELPTRDFEGSIQEITSDFVETLKNNRTWFPAILKYIRKEQQRRESGDCNVAGCLYKIPCYLLQRFRSMPLYEKGLKRARLVAGSNSLHRRRRNIDGQRPSEISTSSASKEDPQFGLKAAVEVAPAVTNCTDIFSNYCFNSMSCLYVKVLNRAACNCRPGYTGFRCDLYNLSVALKTMSQFSNATVDIEMLSSEDSENIYSVLDATARYTYVAYTSEKQFMFE